MLTLEQKSENYTKFVQDFAKSKGYVFLLDSGEGRDKLTETMYVEDISGWLIPVDLKDDFDYSDKHNSKWDEHFVFAEWKEANGEIIVDFKKYPIF